MKRALLAAALLAVLRIPVAALVGLCPDEAYYWVWAQRLDWSYFDHPPMVAWLIAGATGLFGDAEWAVRIPALLAGFAVPAALAWTAWWLAPESRKERAALFTAVLAGVMPALHAAGVIVTIDSPAAMFWSLTLAFLAAALFGGRAWGWYAAGVTLGLALLSKYTAVTLGGSMALLAFLDPDTRRHLKTPHPWLAAVICLAVFSPVVAWNASHDWISFRFQLGHGTAREGGLVPFLEFLAAQAAILTPMLAALVAVHLAKGGHAATRQGDRFLTAAIVPTALFFGIMAARSRPEANWPALAWLGAAVVGGLAMARATEAAVPVALDSIRRAAWGRRLYLATAATGVIGSTVLSVHAIHPLVEIRRDRIVREFHGWEARARAAVEAAGRDGVLIGDSYQSASELAYHSGRLASVGVARRRRDRISMYDFWTAPSIERGTHAVWMTRRNRKKVPKRLAPLFETAEAAPLPEGVKGTVWRLDGYGGEGWPLGDAPPAEGSGFAMEAAARGEGETP